MNWKFWQRPAQEEQQIETPYARAKLLWDTHEHDMQWMKRERGVVALGLFLLCGALAYANIYQLTQAKEFHHFVMPNDNFEIVPLITRQANLMGDSDLIKVGTTKKFIEEYVTNRQQRIMDKQFLYDKLTKVQMNIAGPAVKKFNADYQEHDPFKQIEKEKVYVTILPGSPLKANATTWLVNWTERVESPSGDLLREEACAGHIQVAYEKSRVSIDNVFGLVVMDHAKKCTK